MILQCKAVHYRFPWPCHSNWDSNSQTQFSHHTWSTPRKVSLHLDTKDVIETQVQYCTHRLICNWIQIQFRDMHGDLDSTVYRQRELEYCQTSELQIRLKMVTEKTRQSNDENELADRCWILNLPCYESLQLVVHCFDKSDIELAITGVNAMYNKLQGVSTLKWLSTWT